MKIPCEVFDVSEITALHAGWRTDGSVGRLAQLALNHFLAPTVSIDGVPYSYSAAMARLKKLRAS